MAATAKLNIRIGADARRFRRGMGDVKRVIAGVVAALAGLQFGRIAVAGALEFEKRLLEIDTIARQGKAGIGVFKKGILELGQEIGATTEELTGGLYDALSAGVPNEKALSFLNVAAKAAIAGVTDTKTAVNGLVSIMNAYSLKASEVDRVSDGFFTTIRVGKTTFPELSESIGKTASIAAQAGIRFEELMSSVATLTKGGLGTEVAITSLSSAIVGLLKPATITEDLLGKMGFETGRAAIAALGFQGTLKGLAEAAKEEGLETAKVFANKRALNALFNLTGERAKDAAKDLNQFNTMLGASAAAFGVFEGSAVQGFNRMKAVMEGFTLKIGEEFFPILTNQDNIEKLQENMDRFITIFKFAKNAITPFVVTISWLIEKIEKLAEVLAFIGVDFANFNQLKINKGAISKETIDEARRLRDLGGNVADTELSKRIRFDQTGGSGGFSIDHSQAISPRKLEVLRGLQRQGLSVGDIGVENISGTTKKLLKLINGVRNQNLSDNNKSNPTQKTEELLSKGVAILETMTVE